MTNSLMWIIIFALFAPFTPTIDLYVSGLFYSPDHGFYNNCFFNFLFKYGELFGLATGLGFCGIFLFSFIQPKWKKYRRASLAMILTLVVGAGIITNVCLKGYWGRPRPKQIVEFGGQNLYRPFWHPHFNTQANPQKSFPSGHVAMGFYFLSLCLIGKRYRSKLLFGVGLFLSLFLGCGLMCARVVQGGHFVSDVLASLLIMWYVSKAAVLLTSVGSEQQVPDTKKNDTSQAPDGV